MRLDALGLPRFSHWVEKGIGVIGVLLLFSVKLNLVSFGGQTAGLRLDDLAVLLLSALLAIGIAFSFRTEITRVELYAVRLLALFLLSNLLNQLTFQASNPLYSLRFAEYFLFFYFGAYYGIRYRLRPVLSWILWVNCVVMVLQYMRWIGGFSSGGFVATANRVIGLTGGPWEIGTIINICFAYLINDKEKKSSSSFVLLLFFATLGMILMTGARMPLLAHVAILFLYFLRRSKRPFFAVVTMVAPIALLLAAVAFIPNPVQERSANLFSMDNLQVLEKTYNNIQPTHDPIAFSDEDADKSDDSTDASWVIRTMKWAYVLKLWQQTPMAWFIGLGPGTCGPALDGGWLRITVESGVIGLLFFLTLLRKIATCSQAMQSAVLALSINMIMIDAHLAYKAMSLFFLCAGYAFQLEYRKRLIALPLHS
jgi:hypothetical protein